VEQLIVVEIGARMRRLLPVSRTRKQSSLPRSPLRHVEQAADSFDLGLCDRALQGPLSPFADASVISTHVISASVEASIGRWRRELQQEEQRVCAAAFGDFLSAFGYDRD